MSPASQDSDSSFHDPRMRGFRTRLSFAEAKNKVDHYSAILGTEKVSVLHSYNRVLREKVESRVDVPSFARSAMDGYAIKGEDSFGASEYSPIEFQIIGQSMPGQAFPGPVENFQAVQIMTGAPIPFGANAVVAAEYASILEEEEGLGNPKLLVRDSFAPQKHIAERGEDICQGDSLFEVGQLLRPQDVGLLSSIGHSQVQVNKQCTVDILVNGNELLPAASKADPAKLEAGHIIDSNSPMIAAMCESDGAIPRVLPIASDSDEAMRNAILGSDADVLIVIGGSSVGLEDFAPSILASEGELIFHGVAMRPASPTAFGKIAKQLVFLLPGNPVSCLCAYDLLAGSAIRKLGGRSADLPNRVSYLKLSHKLSSLAGRVDYARVRVQDGQAIPVMVSGASILSSTVIADAFVVIPEELEGIAAGETVEVHHYGP